MTEAQKPNDTSAQQLEIPGAETQPQKSPDLSSKPLAADSSQSAMTPAQTVEPAESVQPAEPIQPAEPVKPVETAAPVAPVEEDQPAEPVKPAKPAKPAKAVKPAKTQTKPAAQAKSAAPAKPTAPAKAAKPAAPAAPVILTLPQRQAITILAATAAGGILLGAIIMFLANGYRAKWIDARDKLAAAESKIKVMESESEKGRIELSNLRLGMSQMNKLFAEETKAPEKPNYVKLDKGILIYWMDGMLWRHYYLYKSQGNGTLAKTSPRSSRKNFIYISDMKPGTWNYAVTALDRQGKETDFSETLTIKAGK